MQSQGPQAPAATVDEGLLAQLMSMGFSEFGCRRALIATSNDYAAAAEWIFGHMEDADFNEPLTQESSKPAPNPETVLMLTSMGFTEKAVMDALNNTDNDPERAVEWLFSHPDGAAEDATAASSSDAPGAETGLLDDGAGLYKLRGFISHIGKNTGSGHYVAHIRKFIPSLDEERWVIFNDQSVALSEQPPREHGYVYLYERL
jgi:ubiquitin carboxyl-terminal hydrolase 5/13